MEMAESVERAGVSLPGEWVWSAGPMKASVRLSEDGYRFAYGGRELVCDPGELRHFRLEWVDPNVATRTLVVVREPRRGTRSRVDLVAMSPDAIDSIVAAWRALHALHPALDLTHVPRNEAYRRMGVSDHTWLGAVVLIAIGVFVTAWFGVSHVQHGLDGGPSDVTLDQLLAGEAEHRQVVVRGGSTLDYGLVVDTTRDGAEVGRWSYLPLVPDGWTPSDPVRVLVAWEGESDEALRSQPADRIEGVLRTAFREGLPDEHRELFHERMEQTLAEDVRVLQIDADLAGEFRVWAIVSGIGNLLMLVLAIFAFRAVRRQGDQPPISPVPAKTSS